VLYFRFVLFSLFLCFVFVCSCLWVVVCCISDVLFVWYVLYWFCCIQCCGCSCVVFIIYLCFVLYVFSCVLIFVGFSVLYV